jgi:hypothetical protein
MSVKCDECGRPISRGAFTWDERFVGLDCYAKLTGDSEPPTVIEV